MLRFSKEQKSLLLQEISNSQEIAPFCLELLKQDLKFKPFLEYIVQRTIPFVVHSKYIISVIFEGWVFNFNKEEVFIELIRLFPKNLEEF